MIAAVDVCRHLEYSRISRQTVEDHVLVVHALLPAFASHLFVHGMDFGNEIWTEVILVVLSIEVWMDGQHECHCEKAAK